MNESSKFNWLPIASLFSGIVSGCLTAIILVLYSRVHFSMYYIDFTNLFLPGIIFALATSWYVLYSIRRKTDALFKWFYMSLGIYILSYVIAIMTDTIISESEVSNFMLLFVPGAIGAFLMSQVFYKYIHPISNKIVYSAAIFGGIAAAIGWLLSWNSTNDDMLALPFVFILWQTVVAGCFGFGLRKS